MARPGHGHDVTVRLAHDAEFEALYTRHFHALLAYALRRVHEPADAADVVADTFTVAWRRRTSIPVGAEAKLWLYGVARNVLANAHRGSRRRDRLGERLRQQLSSSAHVFVDTDPGEYAHVREALERLAPADREVLLLSAWEDLAPQEIAQVIGIGAPAARKRLERARARLAIELGHAGTADGHVMGENNLVTEEAP